MNRTRCRRSAGRMAIALVAAGLLAATMGVTPAGAASSSTLLYSTDGGASWSASPSITADPGATVLVRQWFDNTGSADETAASVTSAIPAGFTLQTGSTQVCLNPSTTDPTSPDPSEQLCAASAESSVWSGSNLSISPSAGHYGESNGATAGSLRFGRKRYLNLMTCSYQQASSFQWFNSFVPTSAAGTDYDGNTNASNVAATGVSCGGATTGYALDSASSGFLALSLLGQRYLNLQQCSYYKTASPDSWYSSATPTPYGAGNPLYFDANTTVSNAAGSASCGPVPASWAPQPGSSGFAALDITPRYLNMSQCVYRRSADNAWYTSILPNTSGGIAFDANTTASNTPISGASCGVAGTGYTAVSGNTGFAAIDLLDASRAHGFVEYALTAPTAPDIATCDAGPLPSTQAFDQAAALTSSPTGAVDTPGTITVNWGALPNNPCTGDPWPMVDPMVGAAGMVAAASAAYVVRRRRAAL